jgi:hypothetical protein
MKTHARSLINLLVNHFGTEKPIRGAEVGVWRGELSECLLNSSLRLTLWMIDPWESLGDSTPTMPKRRDEVIAARIEAHKRTQFRRRTIMQTTSLDAAESLLHGQRFHFVFVDACHMYEDVRDDIAAWLPLILPNGILAGHDYNGRGDRKLGWGVKRAVDERFGDRVRVLPGRVWWVTKNGD